MLALIQEHFERSLFIVSGLIKHITCELIRRYGPVARTPRPVPVLISVTDLIAHLWLKLFNKFEDRQRNATRPKNPRSGRG